MLTRERVYAVGHYTLMLIALASIAFGMYLINLFANDACVLLPPGK